MDRAVQPGCAKHNDPSQVPSTLRAVASGSPGGCPGLERHQVERALLAHRGVRSLDDEGCGRVRWDDRGLDSLRLAGAGLVLAWARDVGAEVRGGRSGLAGLEDDLHFLARLPDHVGRERGATLAQKLQSWVAKSLTWDP